MLTSSIEHVQIRVLSNAYSDKNRPVLLSNIGQGFDMIIGTKRFLRNTHFDQIQIVIA